MRRLVFVGCGARSKLEIADRRRASSVVAVPSTPDPTADAEERKIRERPRCTGQQHVLADELERDRVLEDDVLGIEAGDRDLNRQRLPVVRIEFPGPVQNPTPAITDAPVRLTSQETASSVRSAAERDLMRGASSGSIASHRPQKGLPGLPLAASAAKARSANTLDTMKNRFTSSSSCPVLLFEPTLTSSRPINAAA